MELYHKQEGKVREGLNLSVDFIEPEETAGKGLAVIIVTIRNQILTKRHI